jgi:hypothetical protein
LKDFPVGAPVAEDRKDDGYEFTPPDFDEDAFIHKELVSFKTTSILFVWGIVAALLSWAAYVAVGGTDMGWFIGLAICAAFGYSLRFLFPRLGADIAHFKRKEWTGTGFLFFFTWLSFFVLAINPPITDIAPPQLFVSAGPILQEPGGQVTVDIVATDNGQVANLAALAYRDGAPLTVDFQEIAAHHLQARMGGASGLPVGRYTIQATATDAKGHSSTHSTNFTVGATLDIAWPAGNALAKATDQVLVKVKGASPCTAADYTKGNYGCIRTVFLNATGGAAQVPLEYNDAFGGWIATPNFAGWTQGNHTYRVVAEFPERFLGSLRVPGGQATSNPMPLDVQVSPGDHQVAVLAQPASRSVQVPNLGVGLLAIALLALAFIVRRRAA